MTGRPWLHVKVMVTAVPHVPRRSRLGSGSHKGERLDPRPQQHSHAAISGPVPALSAGRQQAGGPEELGEHLPW